MRVLFTSTFGYGHALPMVPLARALRDAGHPVLWATNGPASDVVTAAGLDLERAGLQGEQLAEVRQRIGAVARDLPPPQRAGYVFPHQFGKGLAPAMVDELLPVVEGFRPDLIVHEQAELGAPLVGALSGVRVVTHAFGGAVPAEFVAAAAALLGDVWAEHGLPLPTYGGCFHDGYLDICPPEVQTVPLDHIRHRLPLRPVTYTGPETELPIDLDDERPLVYVTMGTIAHHGTILPEAVAALRDLPVRVLATVGPDGDPAVLGPQPDNVQVLRWVPQSLLLSHCAVVASHAGSGTFLGALSEGVPQLCLPQAADQFRNAAGGQGAGAALMLTPDRANAAAITQAIQRLLTEDDFRAAADKVSRTIAAMPSPAEVVARLTA